MRRRAPVLGLLLAATLAGAGLPAGPASAADDAAATDADPATVDVAVGVVFDDRDGDGARGDDEPGIPDVLVTNGLDVVPTDDDGRYELPVDDETIISITKPAGWMVPVDGSQLPQFFYIHQPAGTPLPLAYPGMPPTGPLPESVDFPLVAVEEPDEFDVVVFADPQASDHRELDFLRDDVIAELVGVDAAFGLTVGDIVNDDLSLYPRHNALVSAIGLPWWNLPGNHDMNYDVPDDRYATETYKRTFGPPSYSFDYGQVHFVNLDNVEWLGAEADRYRGNIGEEQLAWLANDLAHVPEDRLIVISTHIPLRTDAGAEEGINTADLDALLAVLEGREHVFTMAGHDTSNSWQMYLDEEDGWSGDEPLHHQVLAEVRGGSWNGPLDARGIPSAEMSDGTPNGYYVMSFDGNEYRTRFKPASLPAEHQARISFDAVGAEENLLEVGSWQQATTPQVVANVFDGGEHHVVEVQVDDRGFARMEHVLRTDPYMERLAARYAGTDEAPDTPAVSSHIWTAPLPGDLVPGVHVVTVRSTDPFGHVTETSAVVEVVFDLPGV